MKIDPSIDNLFIEGIDVLPNGAIRACFIDTVQGRRFVETFQQDELNPDHSPTRRALFVLIEDAKSQVVQRKIVQVYEARALESRKKAKKKGRFND